MITARGCACYFFFNGCFHCLHCIARASIDRSVIGQRFCHVDVYINDSAAVNLRRPRYVIFYTRTPFSHNKHYSPSLGKVHAR